MMTHSDHNLSRKKFELMTEHTLIKYMKLALNNTATLLEINAIKKIAPIIIIPNGFVNEFVKLWLSINIL